jgi:amino acid adenylation domain-containing protein
MDLPVRLLPDIIRSQAERRPSAIAVVHQQQRLTYEELESDSNRLARLLQATGCHPGNRVGLLMPKSPAALIGMLGSLKAGCIYVPMDAANPPARLAAILSSCEPCCILAADPAATALTRLAAEDRIPDSIRLGWMGSPTLPEAPFDVAFRWEDTGSLSAEPLASQGVPEDVAHILFTSGSTGAPKGVMITHSNILSFLRWAIPYFGTGPSDRISGHPPLHFDLSTFDVYGTFLAGAQLHLVPPEITLLPHKLAEFIRCSELTQWFSVPSVLSYMKQFDVVRPNDFSSLRRLLWCGESIPTPTLIYWMTRLRSVTFTNLYGPTETTIASSYYSVPACPPHERAEIPIGRPCSGEEILLLDASLQPVAAGETGELYIRGTGLSPGYWQDAVKTAAVFLEDPQHGRLYKTGDLGRIGQDGLLYLLGRADTQIKSRGYRIELGEIEAALYALGLLRECSVVSVPVKSFEGTVICCAYVPAVDREVTPLDMRERLTKLLPPYMVPSQWMALPYLPLNGNGKVDRPLIKARFAATVETTTSANPPTRT